MLDFSGQFFCVLFFIFVKLLFFGIVVAMCDLVHYVVTIYHHFPANSTWKSFLKCE